MNAVKLTSRDARAHKAPMETKFRGLARATKLVMAMSAVPALSGCISVNAPDKPIVIELNINIRQEVLYRIESEVQSTIEQNAGIF